jgi:hypothetical protein
MMVATALSGFVLAGVLAASLHVTRSGVRLANYGEMETQIRGALEQFGSEARLATAIVTNGAGNITLSIPNDVGAISSVTYAWTSATQSFFRVPGTSSAATAGRTFLVKGIPTPTDGTPGVVFERFTKLDAATTSDAATKSVRVSFAARRTSSTAGTNQRAAGFFVFRNKAVP